LTDGALEGLVAGVGAHMDLQGGRRGEVLIANVAQVLVQACNTRASSANFTHKHLLSLIHSVKPDAAERIFTDVLKIPKIISSAFGDAAIAFIQITQNKKGVKSGGDIFFYTFKQTLC
jgi:hypothetical protein